MGFITASRKQQVFFGYSLDEFVADDAKCRFVADLVGELDLRRLYADYSDQGGDAFDPSVMLATWFFAYSEGVTSTRELERRCHRDTHFIYVSADLHPDHCSLSRFRKRHLELLPELFVQVVRLARDRGISDFRRICIDGTRIKANASPDKSLDAKTLDKALAKVRADIQDYLKECELADEENGDLQETEARLAELRRLEAKYEKRKQQLEDRRKTVCQQNRDSHRINVTDPEALNMKKVNGTRGVPAYNGQASVDAESGLIVAAEAVAEGNDSAQFPKQHAQVEENLGSDSKRQYAADKGYHTLEALEYVEVNEVDAVIADPRPERRSEETAETPPVPEGNRRFRRKDFVYDRKNDVYLCPGGERLARRKDWTNKQGQLLQIYYTGACRHCPHSRRCAPKGSKGKKLFRNPREDLAMAMAAKAASETGTARMHERFGTSEPVFGDMKENLGFRSFRLRGLAGAKGEYLLMAIAHNLKVMFKHFGGRIKIEDPAGKGPESVIGGVICVFWAAMRAVSRRFAEFRPHMEIGWNLRAAA